MDEKLEALREALYALDGQTATAISTELIEAGVEPQRVLQEGLAEAMLEIGRRWNAGEVFLPEVVAAAEILKQCQAIVEPALLAAGGQTLGHRVVMATVKGDLHDLGKNMVGAMMKTAGFEVHDLGKDVPPDRIVEAVRELEPTIVGLSALLTTTVPEQQGVIRALEEAGLAGP
jgi:5-methyltetrahydrofolate--homocysteine methyltransferase